ncbi:hypothetical protein [Desulfuromonas acetoxidans]|uniref:4Fe-4S ferredoxin-type domain-containing protein n=1 Tax=Desulfuromonas acetoxidans (strain DSM 684 / 11070) TaxID=281689 RepID=Q1K2I3_DESA6|nr:hypothetical protein [Desulfuromonas acetoxidans]EAT16898.1 hypothetical protein Dace_2150 [Desulfuromonas acetoxidans DSM 684]MBF0645528.1 oxidoreductase [Desulfuromonas acetoxidans]NVD23844.1 oxidoreductase [Desulfuromonas acetoxidans]NVE15759.1 oxidoreductase [Desulfuromonas acetoxidans]
MSEKATQNGLLIHYQWCTGCHACEVAIKKILNLPVGKHGIKLLEHGPWEVTPGKFEWDYIPVPTQLVGSNPELEPGEDIKFAVKHCNAQCMEYGPLEDLVKKAAELGPKVVIYNV